MEHLRITQRDLGNGYGIGVLPRNKYPSLYRIDSENEWDPVAHFKSHDDAEEFGAFLEVIATEHAQLRTILANAKEQADD